MSFSTLTLSVWGTVPYSLLHSAERGHVTFRSAVNSKVNVLLQAHRRRTNSNAPTKTHTQTGTISLSHCNVSMEISTRILIKQHTCSWSYAHYADLFVSGGRVLLSCNHDAIHIPRHILFCVTRSLMFNIYHRRVIFGHNTKSWRTIYNGHLCP